MPFFPLSRIQVKTNDGLTGSEIAEKHKATSATDNKSKCPMCNCSFFLAQVTEQTAEYRKRGGKTQVILLQGSIYSMLGLLLCLLWSLLDSR